MAERVGYSPNSFEHPAIFSATCMKTASVLTISTISPVSTASPISAVWVQFRAQTDTKDTKPNDGSSGQIQGRFSGQRR